MLWSLAIYRSEGQAFQGLALPSIRAFKSKQQAAVVLLSPCPLSLGRGTSDVAGTSMDVLKMTLCNMCGGGSPRDPLGPWTGILMPAVVEDRVSCDSIIFALYAMVGYDRHRPPSLQNPSTCGSRKSSN